jgi:hypothetical protein
MALEIKESDWKLFRQLHNAALERFCERVLNEIRSAMVNDGDSYHDRYLVVFALIRDRDKAIASMFNDVRRSNALILLANIKQAGLLTPAEVAQFSAETREAIDRIETVRRA